MSCCPHSPDTDADVDVAKGEEKITSSWLQRMFGLGGYRSKPNSPKGNVPAEQSAEIEHSQPTVSRAAAVASEGHDRKTDTKSVHSTAQSQASASRGKGILKGGAEEEATRPKSILQGLSRMLSGTTEKGSEGSGIADSLGLELVQRGERVELADIFEGSSAAQEGLERLRPGDVVFAVDGSTVYGTAGVEQVLQRLEGPTESAVTMHFLRDGEENIFVCFIRGATAYSDGRYSWQRRTKRSIYAEIMDFQLQVEERRSKELSRRSGEAADPDRHASAAGASGEHEAEGGGGGSWGALWGGKVSGGAGEEAKEAEEGGGGERREEGERSGGGGGGSERGHASRGVGGGGGGRGEEVEGLWEELPVVYEGIAQKQRSSRAVEEARQIVKEMEAAIEKENDSSYMKRRSRGVGVYRGLYSGREEERERMSEVDPTDVGDPTPEDRRKNRETMEQMQRFQGMHDVADIALEQYCDMINLRIRLTAEQAGVGPTRPKENLHGMEGLEHMVGFYKAEVEHDKVSQAYPLYPYSTVAHPFEEPSEVLAAVVPKRNE